MTSDKAFVLGPAAIRLGELAVSLGLAALGGLVLGAARSIGTAHSSYEQVGPRLFPGLVGAGLSLCGLLLAWQAISGGWRGVPLDAPDHDAPDGIAFLLVSAALVVQTALIGSLGFVAATTLLFVLTARGFGSRRALRDLALGALLSLAAYFLFTRALGLSLPSGLLGDW